MNDTSDYTIQDQHAPLIHEAPIKEDAPLAPEAPVERDKELEDVEKEILSLKVNSCADSNPLFYHTQ
jgi:hypothetical protein